MADKKRMEEMTLTCLREMAKRKGCRGYSSLNKAALITLIREKIATKTHLDEHQRKVAATHEDALVLLVAGPGAGKTTTLCHMIKKIMRAKPTSRICVLSYNRNAVDNFKKRLAVVGAKAKDKKLISDGGRGCFITSFNEYMWHGRGVTNNTVCATKEEKLAGYAKMFREGLAIASRTCEHWDYLVIDEAQDVCGQQPQLINQLINISAHSIIAGDPRQQLYQGAHWFGHMVVDHPAQVSILYNNYRSSPEIVRFLNDFSRKHFGSLHHDQVAVNKTPGCVTAKVHEYTQWHNKEIIYGCIGEEAADTLRERPTGYKLFPISNCKWGADPIKKTMRERLYEKSEHSRVTDITQGQAIPADGYCISNAYQVKGTETDCVVLSGAEADYRTYGNVPRDCVVKTVFVAMSRAKLRLHLIDIGLSNGLFNGLACTDNPPLTRSIAVVKETDKISLPSVKTTLAVTTNLSRLPVLNAAGELVTTFVPVEVSRVNDADFVGLYVEGLVALALGVPPVGVAATWRLQPECVYQHNPATCEKCIKWRELGKSTAEGAAIQPECTKYVYQHDPATCKKCIKWRELEKSTTEGAAIQYISRYGDRYERVGLGLHTCTDGLVAVYKFTKKSAEYFTNACKRLGGATNYAYAYSQLDYSCVIGREWTVSSRLETEIPDVSAAVEAIRGLPEVNNGMFVHNEGVLKHVTTRCGKAVGALIGVPDLTTGNTVLELKHTSEEAPEHLGQVTAYKLMRGDTTAYLVNTLTGTISKITSTLTWNKLSDACRSMIMPNHIPADDVVCTPRGSVIEIEAGIKWRFPVKAPISATIYVAFDFETCLVGGATLITEIGAVAFEGEEIAGTYNLILPGVKVVEHGTDIVSCMTLLAVENIDLLKDAQVMALVAFHQWYHDISSHACLIYWGGSDIKILFDAVGCLHDSFCCMGLYKKWEKQFTPKPVCTLEAAVRQIKRTRYRSAMPRSIANRGEPLPPGERSILTYEPHRAFEDACATMVVFREITAREAIL